MDTTSEKLFNDSYYNTETLNAEECAEISMRLKLEDEPVTPNWRPVMHGIPMSLTSSGFQCPVTKSWKSRTNLHWVDKDTAFSYIENDHSF